MDGFEHKWGFPQCAGAVDGTHIPIVSPKECPADYFNRKGWHSVIMQGLVNHLGQFTNVYVGWPGRVHDARVLVNSFLYQQGQAGSLFPDWTKMIAGVEVPLVILGGPAYPLLPWLMKAFRRWRCLLKRLDVSVRDVPELVSACCVLHNICEVHGESFDEGWMEVLGTKVALQTVLP